MKRQTYLQAVNERVIVFDGAFGTFVQDLDLGPDDFDDAGAGFDQSTGEEATVSEGVLAVGFAGLLGFFFQIGELPLNYAMIPGFLGME